LSGADGHRQREERRLLHLPPDLLVLLAIAVLGVVELSLPPSRSMFLGVAR
jgi:hypothetical protein